MIEQKNQYYNARPMIPSPSMVGDNGVRGAVYGIRNSKGTWQERFLSGNINRPLTLRQERSLPNWLIGKSVLFFFIAFVACTIVWGYPMEMRYAIVSSISVLLFFYGSRAAINGTVRVNEKAFLRNVLIIGFIARMLWAFYGYLFFNVEYYGQAYGDDADTGWYMDYAKGIAEWITNGGAISNRENPISFEELRVQYASSIDDMGYPIWLALIYTIVGVDNDVVVPFIIKCILGAYCAKLVYHVAKRHFGEGSARMAALFVALNPNIIYWCGTMFKETEMIFLCCLCVDLVDKTFSSGNKLTFKSLMPGVLAGMAVSFFRAPLAIVLFLAMFAHIVVASNRVMSMGKKIIAGVMVGIILLVGIGDRLRTQAEGLIESARSDQQNVNMQWRATRQGGNEFAKYAGKAVFAPLIFTIPFPTFNMANKNQILQAQLSGGNYVKNIFSFFVLIVMFEMLISGEWRRHVFILAYTLGYLVTLVLSNFAQSSRFHMPIWPMLMLFAAYGIQISKSNPKYRRWFTIALVVEVVICLGWNWFKLKGRGMI